MKESTFFTTPGAECSRAGPGRGGAGWVVLAGEFYEFAVDEFLHALLSQFAAYAGALDSAEWQFRGGAAGFVDGDHAGLQAVGDSGGAVDVG